MLKKDQSVSDIELGRLRYDVNKYWAMSQVIYLCNELGFEVKLKNPETGHLHCWSRKGKLYQFFSGTGKILGRTDVEGIEGLMKLLQEV